MDFLKTVISLICGSFLPALLFFSGLFFFFRIGRYLFSAKIIRLALGKKAQRRNPEIKYSGFSSLCLALAGTLGVGNITGIASALLLGGAGCIFWLWVCGIVSAVLKFAETLLAMRYQTRLPDNTLHGGGFYYIKNGLNAPKFAALFSVFCIISSFFTGNIAQVRSACDGLVHTVNLPSPTVAIIFASAVLFITLSGGKAVLKFTTFAIPILCIIYIIMSGYVIWVRRESIADVTALIFRDAFTFRAGVGGAIGFLTSQAVRYGICRGIMSNEAGCGTAPIAHAGTYGVSSVRQAYMGVLEVFCDTLLLCTLTAYAVLLSGVPLDGSAYGIAISAFESVLGQSARYLLGISMFFFALASVAGWSHYGKESILSLGGGKRIIRFYYVIFAVFAFAGCFIPENIIWELSDLTISTMAILNVTALLLLEKECTIEIKNFVTENDR